MLPSEPPTDCSLEQEKMGVSENFPARFVSSDMLIIFAP